MDFWKSIGGMVEAELTSASPEEAFTAIGTRNIEIRNLQKLGELTYSFFIPRGSVGVVETICSERGDTVQIRRRVGLYWTVKRAMSRPVILFGGAFLLILVLWIPTRVYFVRVEGNVQIPAGKILAAAEDCGIVFGASRREVRSERVKNALLSAVPELQWAGVNTSGCTAIISIREKSAFGEEKKSTGTESILASRDGYLLSCTATAGNLLVKPGDTVREGQVLISAYTDCGLCIRVERAEGEIMAQTNRKLEAVMLSQYVKKGEAEQTKQKVSLLFRKKRIFLWKDSGIWEGSCGRMYKEYYITLPGKFRLPIALCVETYYFCQTETHERSQEDTETGLKAFAEEYLLQHMVAGKILSGVQTVGSEAGLYRLLGEYACVEMIGTARQEQIGDTNGENS